LAVVVVAQVAQALAGQEAQEAEAMATFLAMLPAALQILAAAVAAQVVASTQQTKAAQVALA
jgi:hypothetical protein